MLPGPDLTRVKDCLHWRKLRCAGGQKTGPSLPCDTEGPQQNLGNPVLRPHSHRLGLLLYRDSSRGHAHG